MMPGTKKVENRNGAEDDEDAPPQLTGEAIAVNHHRGGRDNHAQRQPEKRSIRDGAHEKS
jgi:hypothetical protein